MLHTLRYCTIAGLPKPHATIHVPFPLHPEFFYDGTVAFTARRIKTYESAIPAIVTSDNYEIQTVVNSELLHLLHLPDIIPD